MARRVNTARVKANRSYTVEELADAVGVDAADGAELDQAGIAALNEQRPFLILGWACKEFLRAPNSAASGRCDLGEFFCLRCKCPRGAAHGHGGLRAPVARPRAPARLLRGLRGDLHARDQRGRSARVEGDLPDRRQQP